MIGEPVLGRVSGKMSIPLVLRLDDSAGQFDGVLVTALDPERLVHLFRAIRVGERSVIGLMDREGRLYVWSTSTDPIPADVAAAGVPRSAATVIGDEKRTLRDVVDADAVVALSAVPGTDLRGVCRVLPGTAAGRAGPLRTQHHRLRAVDARGAHAADRSRRAPGHARSRAPEPPGDRHGGRAAKRADRSADRRRQSARVRGRARALSRGARRCGRPFVLAIIDVDRFKRLNDTRGHAVGDRALRRIARTLMGGVRRSDLVARLGGDEFAVLMPDTNA